MLGSGYGCCSEIWFAEVSF